MNKSNYYSRNKSIKDKEALIDALEHELEVSKREQNRLTSLSKKIKEANDLKYTNNEITSIVNKNKALESDLKLKEDQLADAQNQLIYLRENNNTVNTELQVTKHSLNALRKNYIKLRDSLESEKSQQAKVDDLRNKTVEYSEKDRKDYSEKYEISQGPHKLVVERAESLRESKESFYEELRSLRTLVEEKEKQYQILHKEKNNLAKELAKAQEGTLQLSERIKYIDKDLASSKEKATSYKKKFEEFSVENSLLKETIVYKDDKIKRDTEKLKYCKEIEHEYIQLKVNNKNLDEMCRDKHLKLEKMTQIIHRENDKWYRQEKSYQETIENLVKDMNYRKNNIDEQNDDNPFTETSKKEIEYLKEINILKKELDDYILNEQNYEKRIEKIVGEIKSFEILIIQIEEVLRCGNCRSTSKELSINSPCTHLVCKDCIDKNCKECYSSAMVVIQPKFLKIIPEILAAMKIKSNSF